MTDTTREALRALVELIRAAGLENLTHRGVQLGPTVWYVKMSDALEFADKALVTPEQAPAVVAIAPVQAGALDHKPGCDALGGYGHGIGPCSCGATPAVQAEHPAERPPGRYSLGSPIKPTLYVRDINGNYHEARDDEI